MKTLRMPRVLAPLGAATLMTLLPRAHACATCFGASDSKLAQGMNSGILVLLGVVAMVLAGLAGFVVTLAVRSNRARRAPTDSTSHHCSVQS